MTGIQMTGGLPFRVGDRVSFGWHGCLLLCNVLLWFVYYLIGLLSY
jgi:hypothetical protein